MTPEVTLHIVDVYLAGGGRIVVDVDATLQAHDCVEPETTLEALNFVRRILLEERHVITVDGWPARVSLFVAIVWRGPKRREA